MRWDDVRPALDPFLAERCRTVSPGTSDVSVAPGSRGARTEPMEGPFVLYWMRNAARAHENPALDVAVEVGNRLGVPAFVFHGVGESYPYASDRHHTFALEGAREVQIELRRRGIGYALHVQRPGNRRQGLVELGERAALVVVEEVPVQPLRGWRRLLSAEISTPVVAVDADCVVPMRVPGRGFGRAYEFRNAVRDLRKERIGRPWTDVEPEVEPTIPDDLAFQPVDLAECPIPDLVAACDIDHAVGPVPDTPGGGRAGYARWEDFRDRRLDAYARRRNDPADPEGVSGLSPYLHWGHVSPFRIAREASARNSRGADKFIDELVTWRELAHNFCFYDPDHGTVEALPDWARSTLREHETDERPTLMDWETLARGETGDRLWDLCQKSLLRHGMLHNNVRMTWAKKLLEWTPDVKRALAVALDLNHRYGLDGSDPNSYLGIQWCFGAFDRPFDGDKPVYGTLRPRTTEWHAGRIDLDRYANLALTPPVENPPKVAVVGAGVAGSTCARVLADHGLTVEVFEKGRGPGGRASTRRVELEGSRAGAFDHGAQYFTVRSSRLSRYVRSWQMQGVVAPWRGDAAILEEDEIILREDEKDRWVGTPTMSALVGHLQRDLTVRFGTRIDGIRRVAGGWRLEAKASPTDSLDSPPPRSDEAGESGGLFDVLVLTPPAPQTARLLEGVRTSLRESVDAVVMQPTWAVMTTFDDPLPTSFDMASVRSGPLAWIARDTSKPDRPAGESWVLHSTHDWASRNLEADPQDVSEALRTALFERIGLEHDRPTSSFSMAHRWRFAEAMNPLGTEALYDRSHSLVIAGDWLVGSRIEGAFTSGCAAAGHVLRELGR